jgi:hypothetical protein
MQYYELGYSLNPAEVGTTYPQSHIARHPVPDDDPRYLGRRDVGQFLRHILLPEPVVHPDAKISDLLSVVATWRMVMSGKLKKVFEQFAQPDQIQFLPTKVHYIVEQYDYWMLNPMHFNMDAIDFLASETWLCGIGDMPIEKLNLDSIASYQDYRHLVKLPERLVIKKLVLLNEPGADFLQLKDVKAGIQYYVSERFRQQVLNENCTGVKFTKL